MSYGQKGFESSLSSDDFINGSGEYRDAGTGAANQPLVCRVTEHPVHSVQPGGTIGVKRGGGSWVSIRKFYSFEAI